MLIEALYDDLFCPIRVSRVFDTHTHTHTHTHTQVRTRDKEELDHLRERFATEKATKEAMEAERRQMAALEKSKHDAEMRKIKAAETLQREWRAVVKKVLCLIVASDDCFCCARVLCVFLWACFRFVGGIYMRLLALIF